MNYLDDCLSREVLFFTGKGGVGKSTLAWATALACQRRGKRVRIVGWNPLEKDPHFPGVTWQSLNVSDCFREYVTRVLKFETLYSVLFENHVLQAFIRATPGLADTVIAGKIWDLWHNQQQDLLIVDLPSSGHTTSFFKSALGVSKVFEKGFVHEETSKILKLFTSPAVRVDLVALPQELPVTELLELHQKLGAILSLPFGFVHLNQVEPERALPTQIPSGISEEVQACLRGYAGRREQVTESLESLKAMRLPILEVPRFPVETVPQNQMRVSTFFEELK